MTLFKTNRFFLFMLLGLVIGFGFLLYALLQIRFGAGDIYPAYSSLRADPLGTKALFESLHGLDGIQAERNYQRWQRLGNRPRVIFLLGNRAGFRQQEWEEIQPLVESGARVIWGLVPPKSIGEFDWYHEIETDDPSDQDPIEPKDDPGQSGPAEAMEVNGCGFEIAYHEVESNQEMADLVAQQVLARPLPEALLWHSWFYFKSLDPSWKVIYAIDQRAVMIERDLGKGSVVVTSDSFAFSNQALWQAPELELIAWVVGPYKRVVFDETHLGLKAQINLMGLIRRFGFQGLLIGLILLALLFVWQQASSLLPPLAETKMDKLVGQNVASGLIHLLVRGVSKADLLGTCIKAWRKTLKVHQPHLKASEPAVVALLKVTRHSSNQDRALVDCYNQIQKLTTRRNSSK